MGTGTMLLTFSRTTQFHHKHETLRRGSDATSGQPGRLRIFGAGESREVRNRVGQEPREEMNEGERQTSQLSSMRHINCKAVWETPSSRPPPCDRTLICLPRFISLRSSVSLLTFFPHPLPCYRMIFSPGGNHNSITVEIERSSSFLLVLEYFLRTNCQFSFL